MNIRFVLLLKRSRLLAAQPPIMHIPDGYLSPQTCAGLYVAAAPFWYVALRRLRRVLHSELIPLLGLFSAFCFVVMMFNLPLPGGTTGHAVGMGVAAIVLGPWASILAISTALVTQALLFGDGGITAIGANCFNMAVVGSLVAYGCYRLLAGHSEITSRRRVIAAAIAGYAAINAAALCAAFEFGIQPALFHDANGAPLYCPYPLSISIPAMMIGHLTFAGLAELILTAGVVAYLQKSDPALLARTVPVASQTVSKTLRWRRFGLALGVLVVLTPLGIVAIGSAWGEWSPSDFVNPAARQQMSRSMRPQSVVPHAAPSGLARLSNLWKAPLARYAPEFIKSESWAYMLSAAAGVAAIFAIMLLLRVLTRLIAGRRGTVVPGFIEGTLRSLGQTLEQAVFAEELARSKGLLQCVEPRVKLAGIAALVLAVVAVRSIPIATATLALTILLAAASRVPFRLLAKTVWLPSFFFSGLVFLPSIFLIPGTPVTRLPLLGWTITAEGARTATLLLLRVEIAATLSALLIFTTEWARVLRAFRFFRVPVTAVVILGFTYRYIFLLLRAAQEMFESRRSRLLGELSARDRRLLATASASALLGKTIALSSEVHAAMRSRGFQGDVFLLDESVLTKRDYLSLAALLALALLAFMFGR